MKTSELLGGNTYAQAMAWEQEQTLATLMRANRAFERIFGVQEEEGEGDGHR